MKLDDIEKIIAAATPGPWRWKVHGADYIMGADNKLVLSGDITVSKEDAKFIVQARSLMPKLLKVAKASKDLNTVFCNGMSTSRAFTAWRTAMADLEQP